MQELFLHNLLASPPMNLDTYQQHAGLFATYPDATELPTGIIYCALKLAGEAGEYAEKIGKIIRDDGGVISDEKRLALLMELGDVLWYVARSAYELNCTLDAVAKINLDKLESRAARDKLHGSGDNR
jgi:NTP pyrophosphatase (non-canonical NTP hydrolase)